MGFELNRQIVSFEVGIATLKGRWVAMCIKFALADGATVMTHWRPLVLEQLTTTLLAFAETIGLNSLVFRAKSDPSIASGLPTAHPYHALLSQRPTLTDDETGTVTDSSAVQTMTSESAADFLDLFLTMFDERQQRFTMHEYTALSLYGYVQEYLAAASQLAGPAAGRA